MKSTELRIGNLVYDTRGEVNTVCVETFVKFNYQITPITLTDEWFEKFEGFYKDGEYWSISINDLPNMVLPPCHYGFQVYTRELSFEERYVMYIERLDSTMVPLDIKVPNIHQYFTELNIPTRAISLMWNQRSVDTFLGLPFNIASYGLLLEIIAKAVNMVPDELIGNLGDTHLYLNHVEQAKEQIGREPYTLPKLVINDEFWNPDAGLIEQIEHIEISDFEIRDYQSHPTIKAPLSN